MNDQDKNLHLVCYTIKDAPTSETPPVKEVEVANQFGGTQLWVGNATTLCVPSTKIYRPRG